MNGADIEGEILSFEALVPRDDFLDDIGMNSDPLLAFKAKSDPDTFYYHEAMKQEDKKDFLEAMEKEINSQLDQGVYSLVKRSAVPKGFDILPAVWSLRRKRDIKTSEIKKT